MAQSAHNPQHAVVLSKVYLLIDCNNFFVSCERLFRPDLLKRPVLVLSNNDGCVIARSPEVKALGIKMGTPVFEIKDLLVRYRVVCFSSNFNLYLDISNRIMRLLESMVAEVLVYSVDEAFVVLRKVTPQEAFSQACRLKKAVERTIGIPVSIGVATSKTLAKIASHQAKTRPELQGVYALFDPAEQIHILHQLPVGEIWGIGRRLSEKLQALHINSAAQLYTADATALKQRFSITLWRTIQELRGNDEIKELPPEHQQHSIMWSRSFRDKLHTKEDLSSALCNFAAKAAQRLRELKLYTRLVTISIRTSYFTQDKQYHAALSVSFDYPTSDSRIILSAVTQLLSRIYRPGFAYAKAGIVLSDLTTTRTHQNDLFVPSLSRNDLLRSDNLMTLLDELNTRSGAKVFFGAQGKAPQQTSAGSDKRLLSPEYTTNFKEVPDLF